MESLLAAKKRIALPQKREKNQNRLAFTTRGGKGGEKALKKEKRPRPRGLPLRGEPLTRGKNGTERKEKVHYFLRKGRDYVEGRRRRLGTGEGIYDLSRRHPPGGFRALLREEKKARSSISSGGLLLYKKEMLLLYRKEEKEWKKQVDVNWLCPVGGDSVLRELKRLGLPPGEKTERVSSSPALYTKKRGRRPARGEASGYSPRGCLRPT